VARERATYPWPYSNMPSKETSRYGIVMPWDYIRVSMMHALSYDATYRRRATKLMGLVMKQLQYTEHMNCRTHEFKYIIINEASLCERIT
jgi:hypothetical protein